MGERRIVTKSQVGERSDRRSDRRSDHRSGHRSDRRELDQLVELERGDNGGQKCDRSLKQILLPLAEGVRLLGQNDRRLVVAAQALSQLSQLFVVVDFATVERDHPVSAGRIRRPGDRVQ